MKRRFLWLATLLGAAALGGPALADDLPFHRDRHARSGVELGLHLSSYPELVLIPGLPVYYDPRIIANYFFFEGSFWVFEDDDWYRSDWYNGPWRRIPRDEVPVFLLRIPVRYFHRPPLYFRPWALEMPPRWALRWGREWERRHRGWDRWDRRQIPPPAPLPHYQREFPREHYPYAPDLQQRLHERHYPQRPHPPAVSPVPALPPISPPTLPPRPRHGTPPAPPPNPPPREWERHELPPAPPPNPAPKDRERHETPPLPPPGQP